MHPMKHSRTIIPRQWAVPAGMTVAAALALFHGYAHGHEMPLAASPVLYGLGFVLATVCLHGAGIAGRHAMQAAGGGIAASGLVMLFGM